MTNSKFLTKRYLLYSRIKLNMTKVTIQSFQTKINTIWFVNFFLKNAKQSFIFEWEMKISWKVTIFIYKMFIHMSSSTFGRDWELIIETLGSLNTYFVKWFMQMTRVVCTQLGLNWPKEKKRGRKKYYI